MGKNFKDISPKRKISNQPLHKRKTVSECKKHFPLNKFCLFLYFYFSGLRREERNMCLIHCFLIKKSRCSLYRLFSLLGFYISILKYHYSSQTGKNAKDWHSFLDRLWRNRYFHTLPVGVLNCTTSTEGNFRISK